MFINKKIPAFSLVEMLMALLVASLLMAALAPVMTKKFGENLSISGVGGGIIPKTYCAYVNNGNDIILKTTEGEGCLVPDNTYTASAIIASGGGGGGGAADMVLSSTQTLISNINDTTEDIVRSAEFDKWTKEMTVELVGAGGGGGGGNSGLRSFDPSEEVCNSLYGNDTHYLATKEGYYATYDSINKVCVTRYNQASTVNNSTGPCWDSYTNSQCTDSHPSYPYVYSGCKRVVCTHSGAEAACSKLESITGDHWELPTNTQLSKWSSLRVKLALCNYYANYGVAQCQISNTKLNASASATTGQGRPHRYWSSTKISGSTTNYHDWFLDSVHSTDGWATYTTGSSYLEPYSTRCVANSAEFFYPYTGGGGSAGVYASVKVPDSVLLRATEFGKATVKSYSGRPGSGGNGKTTTEAGTGGVSGVEIYDTNGTLVWKVNTPGGKGGYGATTTLGGNANVETTANCTYLDITDKNYQTEKEMPCSKIATMYHSGIEGVDGNADTDFGAGGESWWGGKKSNKTSAGSPGSTPGTGGGGSTCIRNEKDFKNPICYNGGNGGGGAVLVTYKTHYSGAGGGGGGAGAVLHVKNFQVRPGDLIKAQIGHGGNGGSADENGTSGGTSYIEQTRNDETVAKYEVLGGNGGGAGVSGKFSPSLTAPIIGLGGLGGKIADSTKSKLNLNNSEYYPKNPDEAKGSDAPMYQYGASAGGNGGINPKISILASSDGTLNGKPCGGLNTGEILLKTNSDSTTNDSGASGGGLDNSDGAKWQCNNVSHVPLALTRALTENSPFTAEIISTFAAGSTGGGGGGWKYGETPAVSGGAKGLGGYVYIYFGEWTE